MEYSKKRNIAKKIIFYILIFLATLIFILINYKTKTFGSIGIDELLFYLFNGLDGANTNTFLASVLNNIIPFSIIFAVFIIPSINLFKNKTLLIINFRTKNKNHKFEINPTKIQQKYLIVYSFIIFFSSLIYGICVLDIYGYIVSKNSSSSFFENNYINPKDVKLQFPEKKRNLIYITVESMENTVLSNKNGGASTVSLSPELEQIALDKNNVSFSNTNRLDRMLPIHGTGWTAGGMIAQSSGVPILNMSSFDGNELGNFKKFLPGVYSIGEILEKENYYQQIMMGSDASFGGRDKYYSQHGNYKIFDYKTAKEQSKIPNDYHVWWGFEDKKLFEYAKEELSTISESNQPFNLQLLTADTHFIDGYLNPSCKTESDNKYKNVYACSSKQINDFIEWVKQQDFYENTTIIISGDHLGMQTEFYEAIADINYQRTIYNVIINPANIPYKKTNRQFSSFDLYPTTLSSIGVSIEGDELGLGVNLFSDKETLIEKYGLDYINSELQKRSDYYNKKILTGK